MVVIPFLIDKDNNMVILFRAFSSYAVNVIVSYNFFKILYKLYFVFHHHSNWAAAKDRLTVVLRNNLRKPFKQNYYAAVRLDNFCRPRESQETINF